MKANNKKLNQISFTVFSKNNPVPYKRTTQKQKFVDESYKKYQAYKVEIIKAFVKETDSIPSEVLSKYKKYYVDIVAYYKDKKHADTDNVAKGVNDAIFAKPLSDKYVSGSYDYYYDKENPRLCVRIMEAG